MQIHPQKSPAYLRAYTHMYIQSYAHVHPYMQIGPLYMCAAPEAMLVCVCVCV